MLSEARRTGDWLEQRADDADLAAGSLGSLLHGWRPLPSTLGRPEPPVKCASCGREVDEQTAIQREVVVLVGWGWRARPVLAGLCRLGVRDHGQP